MRQESLDEILTDYATTKSLEDRLSVAKRLLKYAKNSPSLPPSKQNMLMSQRSLLYDFWELLKPDCIQRRQGIDQSESLYELHCISLEILTHFNQKKYRFLNNHLLTVQNIHVLDDLLMLNSINAHEPCCVKALEASWATKTVEKARDVMCGNVYDALFDEPTKDNIYDVELLAEDTGENVVDLLSKECDVEVNNLTLNLKSPNTFSETVKVVHVVNPQFVWVQELSDDILEINQDLADHMASAAIRATNQDTWVVVRMKKLNFRGQVLAWKASSVLVFAIDYGWQSEVPHSYVFTAEEHIFEIPSLAKLCRIINLVAPCKKTKLQIRVIKLLQTVTSSEPFAGTLLKNHLDPIVELVKTTRNGVLLCNALLYFSQLCFYSKHSTVCGELMIKPTLSCIQQWFFCTEVLAQGLEVMRNLIANSEKNREMFIFCGGLEFAFNAYATYCRDESVHSQVLHVLKYCLEEYEFESSTYQVYSIENIISSENRSEDKVVFSHLSSMSQYNIETSDSVSFIENIAKQQDLVLFAREVVSYLNSAEGGTIYIGVTYQGLVNGLLMNRARKDDHRTKIDMVISKMVSDYKLTELPNQLVDCSFQRVDNIHKRAMPQDTSMFLIKVFVSPGRTLSRLREGDSNVFFKRRHGCVVPISANELRQQIACQGNDKKQLPDLAKLNVSRREPIIGVKTYPDVSTVTMTTDVSKSDQSHFPHSKVTNNITTSKSEDRVKSLGPPPLVPISHLRNN